MPKKLESHVVLASIYQNNSNSEDDTFIIWIGNGIFTLSGKIFFKLLITDILYTYMLSITNKAKKLKLSQKILIYVLNYHLKLGEKI